MTSLRHNNMVEDQSTQVLSNPLHQKPFCLCFSTALWNEFPFRARPSPNLPSSATPPLSTPLPPTAPSLSGIVVAKCDNQVADFKTFKEVKSCFIIITRDHSLIKAALNTNWSCGWKSFAQDPRKLCSCAIHPNPFQCSNCS